MQSKRFILLLSSRALYLLISSQVLKAVSNVPYIEALNIEKEKVSLSSHMY
jgi:hypothetical protein